MGEKITEKMNCQIAQDLITLYVEDLCSEESRAGLEKHLKSCPECTKKLERFQVDLKEVKVAEQVENITENNAKLNPMKKVKKKLAFRKIIAVTLGLLLIILLSGIGYLSYGEMTNKCLSFSAIADAKKIKRVCEDLTKGEVQDLIDMIAFNMDGDYEVRNDEMFYVLDDYKEVLEKNMKDAYQYHFKGKKIDVKISWLEQTPYEQLEYSDQERGYYLVDFYEEDKVVYTLRFAKVVTNKFDVAEEQIEDNVPSFVGSVLPNNEFLMELILKHYVREHYKLSCEGKEEGKNANALMILLEKKGTKEEKETYKNQVIEKMNAMYKDGIYIKDTMFTVEGFDSEEEKWIYKVWFEIENQNDGSIYILEQKFHFYNYNLYVVDGAETSVVAMKGECSESIENQLCSLFQ